MTSPRHNNRSRAAIRREHNKGMARVTAMWAEEDRANDAKDDRVPAPYCPVAYVSRRIAEEFGMSNLPNVIITD